MLSGPDQVARLKATLARWVEELLTGPHDGGYYQRQARIGRVHVDVRLPSRYMFSAMNVICDDLVRIVEEAEGPARGLGFARSLHRIAAVDLAIMTGTFIEAREQRQLTTLQEVIVSNMPVTVLLLDDARRVTAATASGTRLFGGQDIVGMPYLQALPAPLVSEADLGGHVERAIATGHEVALLRVDARLGDRLRSFRLTIVPLDHPSARVLLHIDELTDTIESEARLRMTESLARLGTFSAAVAHELRNPLAGISGAIQIIAGSMADDDRRRPIMDKVEHQIRRLNAMATELLALARTTPARMARIDLTEAASMALELLVNEHPGMDVRLTGGGSAYADANKVQQIILNLVQNAVQAVGSTGEIAVEIADQEVRVNDDGPGIPSAIRDEIFTPFFTTRTRGTGLGLAICRQEAEAMDATLDLAESALGGASFVLRMRALG